MSLTAHTNSLEDALILLLLGQKTFRSNDGVTGGELVDGLLLLEGNSVSSVVRLTDVHQKTILKLLTLAGDRCERLLSERIRGLEVSDVQADEIWGYVWCKEKNKPTDSPFIGDAYCFVGIERTSKLILAWHLGRRTAQHTMEFTEKLRVATSGKFQITTDGWPPYRDCVPYSLGARADFATLG